MKKFQLSLVESELKIILESITEMESKMKNICESSSDEDEIADIGNDLIEVRLLLKVLKSQALSEYGENIINFSRETL